MFGLPKWNREKYGPGLAYIVTLFHIIVLSAAAWGIYCIYLDGNPPRGTPGNEIPKNDWATSSVGSMWMDPDSARKLGLAVLFGAIGGTLIASRYVVSAVKRGTYYPQRILWQLTTPIHSAILAGVGFFIIRGGLLTLSSSPSVQEPEYTSFVIGFSFLVGLASESFIQRLIKTAETLFGEENKEGKEDRQGGEAAVTNDANGVPPEPGPQE